MTITERLAASDPADALSQSDLSVSLEKLGNVAVAQGDLAAALRSFTESKSIRERLATGDPANAAWQRDLSMSLGKLGELAVAQGDLAGALRYFTEDMAIAERLAASDPANAEWQRDLAGSLYRLGTISAKLGNQSEAANYFGKCHGVLRAMRQRQWHFDPNLIGIFEQLERSAASAYADLVAFEASPSPGRSHPPAPKVSIPNPMAPPAQELNLETLRESAQQYLKSGLWDAAATMLEKLIAQGEPVEKIAPDLVAALLNAHDEALPSTLQQVGKLLNQLEAAGHPALAAELRRKHAAKLAPPAKKPWWKVW